MILPELEVNAGTTAEGPSGPASLRFLIVSSTFPPTGWGGAEIAAEGVALWLAKHGHQVAVYTDAHADEGPQTRNTSALKRYTPNRPRWKHATEQHSKQGAARKALFHLLDHVPGHGSKPFAAAVSDFQPDLVMVHLAPGLGIGVFAYCAEHDLPVVFVMHDFWLTCLRSSMFSRSGATCERRELICQLSSKLRWGALSKVRRLGIWAPSRKVLELAKGQLGDVFPRTLVARNIVDFSDFKRSAPPPAGGATRFLYVGKVTVAKGVAFVLQCLAELPRHVDFVVDVIGTGDAEEQLRVAYRDEPRIRFHGLCGRPEVIKRYHAASALLVPSIWFEPAGLVIYQAQVAGLPVISSDSGGIPELLAGRDDSRVLPAGDRANWQSVLAEFAANPGLRARMLTAAAQGAAEYQATIDAGAASVVDFCRSIVSLPSPTDRP